MTPRPLRFAVVLLLALGVAGAGVHRPSDVVPKPEHPVEELGERQLVAAASRSRSTSTTSSTTSTTGPATPPPPSSTPTPRAADVADAGQGTGAAAEDLGAFVVTCYGPPDFPAGAHTATGSPVGPGSLAVDPSVIALGTDVDIEGLGAASAVDTGGAVRGHHVDLWLEDCSTRGWPNPTLHIFRR